jgi:hypothetical protein
LLGAYLVEAELVDSSEEGGGIEVVASSTSSSKESMIYRYGND